MNKGGTKIKKILIFGKGQIGQELEHLLSAEFEVKILDRASLDVSNKDEVFGVVREYSPQCIVNAAAYTNVEQVGSEIEKAFKANSFGPYFIANAAKEVGALFIHISSDYVFDGTKEFFVETDEPNPINEYGTSKLAGEMLVKNTQSDYYIFRTSAVFGVYSGENRVNFVDRMIDLAKNDQSISVVNDQFTSPTYASDLASRILEFIIKRPPNGIYHVTNTGSCSWYEFTEKIMDIMNLNKKINPILTENNKNKILRPRNSILKNKNLDSYGLDQPANWEDALLRYCQTKYNI